MMIYALIYLSGYIASWLMLSGWFFAESQRRWPSIAAKDVKSDSGHSIVMATLSSIIWPLMLPAFFCATGYAEYGWKAVWRLTRDNSEEN